MLVATMFYLQEITYTNIGIDKMLGEDISILAKYPCEDFHKNKYSNGQIQGKGDKAKKKNKKEKRKKLTNKHNL